MDPASLPNDAPLPATDMLYMTYEGNWLTKCSAKVLSVQTKDATVEVVLDRTILHAQGGGQPTDKGTIQTSFDVTSDDGASRAAIMRVDKVLQDRSTGVTTHYGTMENMGALLQMGNPVQVVVDQPTRCILSECHTAGHVVDSAMAQIGKPFPPSKAYHFLDGPYVEYKGSIPVDERDDTLRALQSAFCQLLEQDIATKIELMTKEEADAVCNRQAASFDMDVFCDAQTQKVRVVTVAGFPCPCGGTHVRSTAALKENGWSVTGIKSKKNVVRIRYGQRVGTAS